MSEYDDYNENIRYVDPPTENQLRVRIINDSEMARLELDLRGQELIDQADGTQKVTTPKGSYRRMNDTGVRAVMSLVRSFCNSMNVQGNLDETHYNNIMFQFKVNLAEILMVNVNNWDIKDDDLKPICETIKGHVEIFTTRAIDNLERESYYKNTSMRQFTQPRKSGGLFGRKETEV